MSENIEVSQRWWSVSEVADALNVSPQSISNWCREGLLAGHRFGNLWRVSDSDLQEFLRRARHAANAVRQGGEPSPFAEQLKEAQAAEPDEVRAEA